MVSPSSSASSRDIASASSSKSKIGAFSAMRAALHRLRQHDEPVLHAPAQQHLRGRPPGARATSTTTGWARRLPCVSGLYASTTMPALAERDRVAPLQKGRQLDLVHARARPWRAPSSSSRCGTRKLLTPIGAARFSAWSALERAPRLEPPPARASGSGRDRRSRARAARGWRRTRAAPVVALVGVPELRRDEDLARAARRSRAIAAPTSASLRRCARCRRGDNRARAPRRPRRASSRRAALATRRARPAGCVAPVTSGREAVEAVSGMAACSFRACLLARLRAAVRPARAARPASSRSGANSISTWHLTIHGFGASHFA